MSSLSFVFLGLITLVITIKSEAEEPKITDKMKKTVGEDGIPTFTYTSLSQLSFSDSSSSGEGWETPEEITTTTPFESSTWEVSDSITFDISSESSSESFVFNSPEIEKPISPESSWESSSESVLESSSESNSENSPEIIPETTPAPTTLPGTTGPQQFQYSSYSQIPKDVLDQLSDEQKENVKKMLSGQMTPEAMQLGGGVTPDGNSAKIQGLEFHSFNDLPKSFNFPGVNNTIANDLVNTIFNYVSVGGQLTGIPPVDLLLLRFYLHQGPQNFCGPHPI